MTQQTFILLICATVLANVVVDLLVAAWRGRKD